MRLPELFRTAPLVFCFALIFICGAATIMAQEATSISGEMSATYTQREDISIGDAGGHMVSLAKSEGTNKSTGERSFMDGAQTTNIAYSDLVKGNGSHQGYIIFANEGDTTIAKWEGKVTATMSTENTMDISYEGSFSYISGTGKYLGISGSGTYKGSFTSEDTYSVTWQGEFHLGE